MKANIIVKIVVETQNLSLNINSSHFVSLNIILSGLLKNLGIVTKASIYSAVLYDICFKTPLLRSSSFINFSWMIESLFSLTSSKSALPWPEVDESLPTANSVTNNLALKEWFALWNPRTTSRPWYRFNSLLEPGWSKLSIERTN